MTPSKNWQTVFKEIQSCHACAKIKSFPNEPQVPVYVVNPLAGRTAEDWGIYWYDHFRNLNGRVMIVGMDFGDKSTIDEYRRTGVTPDKGGDKTFGWLSQFIRSAQIDDDVFLTNAALCVRDSDKASGDLDPDVYDNCLDHLRAQIEVIRPEVIVTLGEKALAQTLKVLEGGQTIASLWPGETITRFAGSARKVSMSGHDVFIFPVVHPAYEQPWPRECPWKYPRQEAEFARVRTFLSGSS